jgi:proteasome assembly chaperone (PAC2) family protein
VTITAGEHERVTQRLVVAANAKASVRLFLVSLPQQVMVNDGSVPEMDMNNNTAAISPPAE